MNFTAKGFLSTKNGGAVEVEGVSYWISGQDLLRVAQAKGVKTEGLRCNEFGIDGEIVTVIVHRDHLGCWAELGNQDTWCPNVI